MSGLVEVLLLGAAGWRAAALLSYERGPFNVFLRFRERVGFLYTEDGDQLIEWKSNVFTDAVSCIWCLSVWMIVAMYGVWQIEPVLVMLMAAMAIPPMIEKWAHP